MTGHQESPGKTPTAPESKESLTAQFARAVRNTRAAIFIERAVPRILPPLYTGGLFLSASWAGLWAPLPVEARIAGVLGFAAALALSPLFAKTKSLRVSRDDALRRMDDIIGDPSRPAQSFDDQLSDFHSTPSKELWKLHQTRIWDQWGDQFKADKPHIDLASRDPYRLRYAVSLALVVTAFMAGGQHAERVADAFDWTRPPTPEETQQAQEALKIKAWITPPDHIDMPPVPYLNEATRDHLQGGSALTAHKSSILTIVLSGKPREIRLNGEEIPVQKMITPKGQGLSTYYYDIRLNDENSVVTIENGPKWHFNITQDQAPNASLDQLKPNDNNIRAFDITCTAKDDFGVIEGEVVITLPGQPDPKATPLPSGKISPIPIPAPCTPQ